MIFSEKRLDRQRDDKEERAKEKRKSEKGERDAQDWNKNGKESQRTYHFRC